MTWPVAAAIVGFRAPDQVARILAAANLVLADDELDQIEGGMR
jgi:aryl-alcohol dehydrogenase-like predicted oxidoreductase